jgi:hypothetical protein
MQSKMKLQDLNKKIDKLKEEEICPVCKNLGYWKDSK